MTGRKGGENEGRKEGRDRQCDKVEINEGKNEQSKKEEGRGRRPRQSERKKKEVGYMWGGGGMNNRRETKERKEMNKGKRWERLDNLSDNYVLQNYKTTSSIQYLTSLLIGFHFSRFL